MLDLLMKNQQKHKKKQLQFKEIYLDVGNRFDINKRDVVVELYLRGTFIDVKIKYKNIKKKEFQIFLKKNKIYIILNIENYFILYDIKYF